MARVGKVAYYIDMNDTEGLRTPTDSAVDPQAVQPPAGIFSMHQFKMWARLFLVSAGIILAGIVVYVVTEKIGLVRGIPLIGTEEVYMLVRDKVSKSASVPITLPDGVSLTPEEAEASITFTPELNGRWVAGGAPDQLFFEPQKPLELSTHYTVTLAMTDGSLSKDFFVDEDPQVLAIFPRADSETPEYSDITIVFNRPMVPLTTLNVLDAKNIPVVITPATEGTFRWITTRNLQFTPKTRLLRSSTYSVRVRDGFVSMDGLPVGSIEHTFTTRPLRYAGELTDNAATLPPVSSQTLYHEPILLRFNQPVDIDKTRKQIEVRMMDSRNASVPILVEYGTRTLQDDSTGKSITYTDKSILAVYGAQDRFGRSKFWDFDTRYQLVISKADPLEGTATLSENRIVQFTVPKVVESVFAESNRSNLVEPDIFDPQGTLWITFYEDIDKDASTIKAPHLRDITYAEQCAFDSDGFQTYGADCVKVSDKKKIGLTFDSAKFQPGEIVPVELRKLVNVDAVSLIEEMVPITAVVFPTFKVTRTSPSNGTTKAKLTELVVCSNTPLLEPDEETFYTKFKSNISFGRWNWNDSYRITASSFPYYKGPCTAGEFQSVLRYGLAPESHYDISMSLQDVFGGSVNTKVSFDSGALEGMYRRIGHLQKAYNVTSPERTTLSYTAENLEYVNVNVCTVSAETLLGYIDMNVRPDPTIAGENLGCLTSVTRKVELPKKYFSVNYFQVNLEDDVPNTLGHYIISIGHPEYRQMYYDRNTGRQEGGKLAYERTFITVTNLAVQEKKIEGSEWTTDQDSSFTDEAQKATGGNLYFVTHFGSLAPVIGARVDLYRKGAVWATGGTTNKEGVARTKVMPMIVSAVVTYGNDSAVVSSQLDKFQWASSLASARKTYVYTDRPIYRPTEDVFVKGLYRIGYDGEYEILNDKKAHVEVFDSRGESVYTEDVALSEYGTFAIKMNLQKTAPLGTYRIEALGGNGYFEVQEYVPASFSVQATGSKEEYIAGDTLSVAVDASYYFGVPVEAGSTVNYSILAQDYYFDRYSDTDGYFQFGKGWYYLPYRGYGDQFIVRNKTKLNANGKATIQEQLDFDSFFNDEERGQSKLFTLNISVQNKQGQTISTQKTFIVHQGLYYVGANLTQRYFGKNQENTILVKSVDTDGKPVKVGTIDAVISKVTWESFKRQEVDGRFYYQSEEKKEPISTYSLSTDKEGDGSKKFTIEDEGQYELTISSTDKNKNTVSSTVDFYVYGNRAVSVRPTNNETLDIAVNRNTLHVGETAEVIVKSPYEKGKALVTIERGRIFEYQIIDVTQNLIHLTVPIKEEYIPNMYLSVILISPRPEVKYGQVSFQISSVEKELRVSVAPLKQYYLPGEQVTLRIETKNSRGGPEPAEVSVAVADLSVLALKGNPKKNPIAFFYAGLPLGVMTASNIKNILYEAEIPKGTKGGGGGDAEDLARKKRGVFKSTAFWDAKVQTDKNGLAEVTFTLPDNLTTWQSEALAITKDTKVGVGYSELISRKELMVVPEVPRFIIPGDTFTVGAKVFNETGKTLRFNVGVQSSTLVLPGSKNAFVKIGPSESQVVYFDAIAPLTVESGVHTVTISAEAPNYIDTVDSAIAVQPNTTYESTATMYSTTKDLAQEFVFLPENVIKDKGALTINVSATLSMYITDALAYLIAYPYGCSEQLASKLNAIAILKHSLEVKGKSTEYQAMRVSYEGGTYSPDDLIEIGLARIYANKNKDGGFGYYTGLHSDFYLTLHILSTLENLRQAGYLVSENIMRDASSYLQAEYPSRIDVKRKDKDTQILLAYTLERLPTFAGRSTFLRNNILSIAGTKSFVNEDASNLSLAYLSMVLSNGDYPEKLRDDVLASLENRLTIDGRGAFLNNSARVMYEYYETPIKNTALLVQAWAKARKDTPLAGTVLSWLQKSRAKDGGWGSSQNTLAVLQALSDYVDWKQETNAHFELSTVIDNAEVGKITFDSKNNEVAKSYQVPISKLSLGVLHPVNFLKKDLNSRANTFYYNMGLTYFLPMESIGPRDEGFTVTRAFYRLSDTEEKNAVLDADVGEVLRTKLTITVPKERRLVAVESFIPAGVELINFTLATEDKSLEKGNGGGKNSVGSAGTSKARGLLAGVLGQGELPDEAYSNRVTRKELLVANSEELHDDRLLLFKENLPPGVYEYEYYIRALIPGTFQILPSVVSELYTPENFGRTGGALFTVNQTP
ncbi:MAG: hypothetical protein COV91_03110 [Candidatus Taylorbacteria bacterium CG11_big_fil_rev_8_21_14_0_20_46_11]|uniref:Alpha-2-macroglobulin n=1 Tax=Candidatus Taylorbacteria bacterium CG11_big_fil_rev_8_21_14_0_20_46_11 TaxID=1975025 RepID=A0A2H0KBN4_9BACT|nr:MAG: hypothetical protein COV91_03110 [Candidatus Taylorbacteria bacterium CG11_big_fil_rev_8_21_14_0_20_46_11]